MTELLWYCSKYPWRVSGVPDDSMDEYLEKWKLLT